MLPPPSDPNYRAPVPTEAEFFKLSTPEDDALLATGAWDDQADDGEEPDDIDASTGPGVPAA